jgi:hypothetical protein
VRSWAAPALAWPRRATPIASMKRRRERMESLG